MTWLRVTAVVLLACASPIASNVAGVMPVDAVPGASRNLAYVGWPTWSSPHGQVGGAVRAAGGWRAPHISCSFLVAFACRARVAQLHVDVRETPGGFDVKADLPGFNHDNVKVGRSQGYRSLLQ